jgi:cell division protein FtsB
MVTNRENQNWRKEKRDNSKNWVKFFLIVCLASFAIVAYSLFKETYKKRQIQEEVKKLQEQATSLEQGNQKLKGLIDYFRTQNFSEKEAREKLNVKKEGEKVVILRSQEEKEEKTKEDNLTEEKQLLIANPLKWWSYFFGEREF